MRVMTLGFLVFFSAMALAGPEEDVRCREIGFSQSVEQGRQERFTSFLDEDARFVSSSVLRGPDAITQAWSVFFAEGGPRIKWRPQIIEVLEDGRLALSRGPYRMTTKDEQGDLVESWGTFNSVWRLKADGEWKVVFDAGSPANSEPADEVKALLDAPDSCPRAE